MTDAERLSDLYGVTVQTAARLLEIAGGDLPLAEAALQAARADSMPELAEAYLR